MPLFDLYSAIITMINNIQGYTQGLFKINLGLAKKRSCSSRMRLTGMLRLKRTWHWRRVVFFNNTRFLSLYTLESVYSIRGLSYSVIWISA